MNVRFRFSDKVKNSDEWRPSEKTFFNGDFNALQDSVGPLPIEWPMLFSPIQQNVDKLFGKLNKLKARLGMDNDYSRCFFSRRGTGWFGFFCTINDLFKCDSRELFFGPDAIHAI